MNLNQTKKTLAIIILLITCTVTFAQNRNTVDSLENKLETATKKEKPAILNELAKAYLPDFSEKAKENASLALQLAKNQNNRIEQAFALKYTGMALYYQSKYEEALEHYNNSLKIFKELDNKPEIAKLFNNIGIFHCESGDYEDAWEYFQKSLKIHEEIKDKKRIATSLNNIGIVYKELKNYEDALEYHQKSLKIDEIIGNKKGVASSLNSMGTIYKELRNYEDALEYFQKSLKIKEEIGDKKGIANSLNNIGIIYKELNNYEDALEYYQKSLKIKEEIEDKRGIASSLNNIGVLYNKLGNFSEALLYFDKSFEIAESLNIKYIMINNYDSFSETYSAMGNYKKAFEYHKRYTALKDSVFNSKTYKKIADMKNKYETEKNEKQIQELTYETKIQKIKINHYEKTHRMYLMVILLSITAISIIIIQFRKKNSAYKFLVTKNLDVLSKEKELRNIRKKLQSCDICFQNGVSDDEKGKILKKIIKLFNEDKIFKMHDLTLYKLAKRLSTNRSYLSRVINDEFEKNYSEFINEYRINEAMHMLSDYNKSIKFSIETIAKEAGFKTTSSFNSAFKKSTGITPSVFRSGVNNQ